MPAVLSFAGRALSHARLHEQARIEARVDGLTGLYNYRWMTETLRRELQRAQRHDVPLTLLMLDLDGLKQVNDRCGHRAGDAVLRHVAAVIRSALREADSAARCGGDEFVLLLPDTDAAGAMHVAERVVRGLRDARCGHGGQELPVAASVGVAQWRSGWTVEQWIEAADQAMYAAKRAKLRPDGDQDHDAPALRAAPADLPSGPSRTV
jgi:diguanylate cyclase (GGDEF)-like protein